MGKESCRSRGRALMRPMAKGRRRDTLHFDLSSLEKCMQHCSFASTLSSSPPILLDPDPAAAAELAQRLRVRGYALFRRPGGPVVVIRDESTGKLYDRLTQREVRFREDRRDYASDDDDLRTIAKRRHRKTPPHAAADDCSLSDDGASVGASPPPRHRRLSDDTDATRRRRSPRPSRLVCAATTADVEATPRSRCRQQLSY
ncbi:hypothetical protein M885DRAFT_626294 [Pelagophyceae sp. CCMP2097]|nr:hypothetical protein M885DRAFT_626294 [Pelagophyceae sp. CCMP2097]|mmetsp:Transcript_26345/g.90586  ORF Transcript_26345/g.90586 Transcript_26345/m.90586 type:complete len:201 (+) Transcript_26345:47-649(+)